MTESGLRCLEPPRPNGGYNGPSKAFLELMGCKNWKGAPPLEDVPVEQLQTIEEEPLPLETDYEEPPTIQKVELDEIRAAIQKVADEVPLFLAVRDLPVVEQVKHLASNYLTLVDLVKKGEK